jgi:hypothetical protein
LVTVIPSVTPLAINFEIGTCLIRFPSSVVAPFCKMKQPIIFCVEQFIS